MEDYAHPNSLVDTRWIAEHSREQGIRLVEILWGDSPFFGRPAYASGHLPGALAWDFETDLQDPARRDIVDQPGLEALLARSGIAPGTTIVVYSGLTNLLATFAFWVLKIYGHRDVRLLDCGRQKWLDEGRPTEQDAPAVAPSTYQARTPDWSLRASRADILGALGQADRRLVDARSAEMFAGQENAGAARGGHIPGAVNLPAVREINPDGSFRAWRVPTLRADGTFRPAPELQALVENLGITPEREIITYCVRGGLSTHAWFMLTQLLGYPRVREYDRSWAEWGNLPEVPIEN